MVIHKKQLGSRSWQSGVTLIEMLVVVGIFSVISSVILFNYSDFSTTVSLKNLTQDIALTLRKAQTYATSVQSLPNGSSTTEFPSYGMSFSPDTSAGGAFLPYSKRFVLFADIIPADKKYSSTGSCGSPSSGNECVESITITGSDKIKEVCVENGVEDLCSSGSAVLDITFQRPSPDAIICYRAGGYADNCAFGIPSYAKIKVQSAKGVNRTILIWNTGQISTQ